MSPEKNPKNQPNVNVPPVSPEGNVDPSDPIGSSTGWRDAVAERISSFREGFGDRIEQGRQVARDLGHRVGSVASNANTARGNLWGHIKEVGGDVLERADIRQEKIRDYIHFQAGNARRIRAERLADREVRDKEDSIRVNLLADRYEFFKARNDQYKAAKKEERHESYEYYKAMSRWVGRTALEGVKLAVPVSRLILNEQIYNLKKATKKAVKKPNEALRARVWGVRLKHELNKIENNRRNMTPSERTRV